ncbi:Uncharacterised protein [Niallia circulans]|uniref:hypothetical protein n=1 Tax=Niallia circulans TaxID=1397 RepID=UPI00077C1F55|nr:hypothetical protein [Niallia circulans]MDR4318406.1 hypothetical protein [Niallia circulans]MED3839272.1 hypothetical protein [Niallia circulans]MED4242383.1 hypothetical protein [Niallia circulans]MED4250485.1 hypothetical protein [Niallia circulans]QKH59824.1 hypothetical protein FOC77_03695 [Niallia circulans]
MEKNKIIKENLILWLNELNNQLNDFDNQVGEIEREIDLLKTKRRILSNVAFRFEQGRNTKEGYVFEELDKVQELIETKEEELTHLTKDIEYTKIDHVKELIKKVEKEIRDIEASE